MIPRIRTESLVKRQKRGPKAKAFSQGGSWVGFVWLEITYGNPSEGWDEHEVQFSIDMPYKTAELLIKELQEAVIEAKADLEDYKKKHPEEF